MRSQGSKEGKYEGINKGSKQRKKPKTAKEEREEGRNE